MDPRHLEKFQHLYKLGHLELSFSLSLCRFVNSTICADCVFSDIENQVIIYRTAAYIGIRTKEDETSQSVEGIIIINVTSMEKRERKEE